MQPSLIDIVNEWLKVNKPTHYVTKHGSIGLVDCKDITDRPVPWFGAVNESYVQFFNPDRFCDPEDVMIHIYAYDPEFFEKLTKYLPH